MERLIESCKINNKSASIELVFSNNAKASGLSYAKNRGIETSVIDHRIYEKREDFDHELDKKLRENNIDLICKVVSEKRGIWKFDCKAELNNELICTATILCADRKAK